MKLFASLRLNLFFLYKELLVSSNSIAYIPHFLFVKPLHSSSSSIVSVVGLRIINSILFVKMQKKNYDTKIMDSKIFKYCLVAITNSHCNLTMFM